MNHKILLICFLILLNSIDLRGQNFFPEEDLMSTGVYYYPEHWNPEQWERDINNISRLGFEFIHMAEFSWAMLEPEEGVYDFSWLDSVITLAAKYGLKVILCTPTPCPPVWLGIKYPDIYLMDAVLQRKEHGTRANLSLTNPHVKEYTQKIVAEMGRHYKGNPNIKGWQIDNEPDAKEDYSPSAQLAFRQWLENKYKTTRNLNAAWGTAFWSQQYQSFDQVRIPNAHLVGWWGTNPMALLDFKRFSADMQADFLDLQTGELRKYIPTSQFITTNYMVLGSSPDPRRTKYLDFPAFTAYPNYGSDNLGENGFRKGDYSLLMYGTDYFRSVGGVTGIMELQPGQVNWGRYNPLLMPGTVRMWLWHSFGGGCSFACTYRYRQILYGAEQYHAGIVTTDGSTLSEGGKEFAEVIGEVKKLRKIFHPGISMPEELEKRKTAILWNFDNFWNLENQKQTAQWDTWEHLLKYHRILKSLGTPVDFVDESSDFSQYDFLVAPAYQQVDTALVLKWKTYVESGGNLVLTCRTGMKNKNAHFWESNLSGIINGLIGGEIQSFDMMPPHHKGQVELDDRLYAWNTWGERIKPDKGTEILARYADQFYQGDVCCLKNNLGKGTIWYIGVDTEAGDLEKEIIRKMYTKNGISVEDYPEGVLVYWRSGFMIAVNYSSENYQIDTSAGAKFIIGDAVLAPADVAVWRP